MKGYWQNTLIVKLPLSLQERVKLKTPVEVLNDLQ